MKNLKFLQIVLLLTLCSCSACEEEDDKLPGTKPEILIGKWERLGSGGLFFDSHTYWERYEFTETGGMITRQYYNSEEQKFDIPKALGYFQDWSYSEAEEKIHFVNHQGSRWYQYVLQIAPDSIVLGIGTYHKITN
ncbi:hypothetical protein EZS27_014795 [termite gut metagenome]|uniref:Lipocalin-like domain-containing protein n=1 Tax=termite gut metagenome TaxID=433724 RepID=A0A5J4RVX0_9ZZZZ